MVADPGVNGLAFNVVLAWQVPASVARDGDLSHNAAMSSLPASIP